ncbi:MAG: VOC family protein [Clostridia bacterium]|nr:VOC family protein [Clostridia bacterium]
MSGLLGTNIVTQVGIIVRDIEVTKRKYAALLGVEPPACVDGGLYEVTGTQYRGEPAPYANCLMAFFDAGPNMQIELIQPNGEKSTWQDHLDQHGEGVHHIAFKIQDMDGTIRTLETAGMPCTQRGRYNDGSGEYAYIDATGDLKCFIELLHSF